MVHVTTSSGMFVCHFWHNFDGPIPIMAHTALCHFWHNCVLSYSWEHVPFQPKIWHGESMCQ